MKFDCPYCGKECDFMDIQGDKDLTAIIKMQTAFGNHAHLVWAYVELFGIRPMRAKTKKIRILLDEMKNLFEGQAFSYQKRKYSISRAGISEALNVVVHRHFTDSMENHNYLKKVMIGISEREEKAAGKQAEKDLKKKENHLRYEFPEERVDIEGSSGKGQGVREEGKIEKPTAEQIAANKLRIKGLLKSIG